MPIKGAIIGFGHIAANGHVPAYRANPNITIQAVCDNQEERRSINNKLLPGSRFYSSAQELFEREDIDFVDVSTPPAAHAPFILKALASGRHVLCEKPLVLSAKDLTAISKTMKNSAKTVVTVHNWRYSPILQKVSSLIKGGQIGQIIQITYEVIRTQPSVAVQDDACGNWRLDPDIAGGGILVDHGWHAFYLVNEWACSMPESVECTLEKRKFKDIKVEDTADVRLCYPKRLEARLFFTWAGEERSNRIEIEGSRGSIKVLDDRILIEEEGGPSEITFSQGLSAGSHHPDWYGAVIEEFLEEMNNPRISGRNFQEAASCFNILDHCRKSNKAGGTVKIEDWNRA